MKAVLAFVAWLILACQFILGQVNPNYHTVKGHYRNGTYVQPYNRTNPNSTNVDNYSTKPNINPWTGEKGSIEPDYQIPTYSIPYNNPSTAPSTFYYTLQKFD